MADLGISAAIAIAIAAAAAAGTAATTIVAAEQQSKAATYNAQVADLQAQQAQDAAKLEEEAFRDRAKRIQAQNRAEIGASGVSFEGSPLLVLMENASMAEYEAQRIKYSGGARAAGFQSEAALQRFGASQAKTAGLVGAGTSLLSSSGSIAGAYYGPRLRTGTSRTTTFGEA
jgi:hypothetical protein